MEKWVRTDSTEFIAMQKKLRDLGYRAFSGGDPGEMSNPLEGRDDLVVGHKVAWSPDGSSPGGGFTYQTFKVQQGGQEEYADISGYDDVGLQNGADQQYADMVIRSGNLAELSPANLERVKKFYPDPELTKINLARANPSPDEKGNRPLPSAPFYRLPDGNLALAGEAFAGDSLMAEATSPYLSLEQDTFEQEKKTQEQEAFNKVVSQLTNI